MEISSIIPHIEALVFASDKPLTSLEVTDLINTALGFIEDRASLDQVEAAIDGIKEKYDAEFYAFELKQSGGGWQFLTKPAFHKTVALINGDKFIKRLSTAALETLAIIAYKQPITKSEIESIRGVNCDYAVQKLLEKDLVVISGRNEDAVGKPLIYSTSKSFMDYFGINSADELPKISEVLMEEFIKATAVSEMLDVSGTYQEGLAAAAENAELSDETVSNNDEIVLMDGAEATTEETVETEEPTITEEAGEEIIAAAEEEEEIIVEEGIEDIIAEEESEIEEEIKKDDKQTDEEA
ncbi:SMC-Scp complex subunit ScpB [Ferruginibacter sp. HRS2-29]|uniref:SMC-Scp complex subunit ScpB n=1 Tax=Ferruginibacter sp. HRS2-29 TaxID=2487334 RepID=UPI0020CE5D38|nr:SMC-Scp complex subunit ScpB [Ferruginibacter sp. HRS2-29]MCP9751868.1 SMC-Scp complex subunit ScpB [Ferruginibacter sp. HRS2-29]